MRPCWTKWMGVGVLLTMCACTGTAPAPNGVAPAPPAETAPPTESPAEAAAPVRILDTMLQVDAMVKCNECALKTRVVVREQPGIIKVKLNIQTGQMLVFHDGDKVSAQQLEEALDLAGWPATLVSSVPHVPGADAPGPIPAPASGGTGDTDTSRDADQEGGPASPTPAPVTAPTSPDQAD